MESDSFGWWFAAKISKKADEAHCWISQSQISLNYIIKLSWRMHLKCKKQNN